MTGINTDEPLGSAGALGDDAALLNEAVLEAGRVALDFFGKGPGVMTKPDGTKVTDADYAVNDYLLKKLTKSRPDYGWLSEETAPDASRLSAQRVWIIDPIDGTNAFIREQTDWTIAAALVEDGRPVAGVVYAPAREEFYAAAKGQGAKLNGNFIQVNGKGQLEGARIISGKSLFKSSDWAQPWPEVDLIWANSMAYRVCLVAHGAADAVISLSKKSDWDIAGAHIILEEAGGMMSNETGAAPRYNKADLLHMGIVGAGPDMLKALQAQENKGA